MLRNLISEKLWYHFADNILVSTWTAGLKAFSSSPSKEFLKSDPSFSETAKVLSWFWNSLIFRFQRLTEGEREFEQLTGLCGGESDEILNEFRANIENFEKLPKQAPYLKNGPNSRFGVYAKKYSKWIHRRGG